MCMHAQLLSCVQLFVTPWTVACQAPLSMEFSRQEYWRGCHFLPQGIFLTQGANLCLCVSCKVRGFFTTVPPGKPCFPYMYIYIHTYTHTHTHTHLYTHIHTYTHTHIHTYTHIYTHIHTYTHTYIHTHTHTYTHL